MHRPDMYHDRLENGPTITLTQILFRLPPQPLSHDQKKQQMPQKEKKLTPTLILLLFHPKTKRLFSRYQRQVIPPNDSTYLLYK